MRFPEGISRPVFRAHPAFGLLRVQPDESLFGPTERQFPRDWLRMSEEREEEILTSWYFDLLTTVAGSVPSRLLIELSDSRGRDQLRALDDCSADKKNRFAFECAATAEVFKRALQTNPARGMLMVNGEVLVSLADGWEGMFLHVETPELVERFGSPASR